jgi:hypothetical protein
MMTLTEVGRVFLGNGKALAHALFWIATMMAQLILGPAAMWRAEVRVYEDANISGRHW